MVHFGFKMFLGGIPFLINAISTAIAASLSVLKYLQTYTPLELTEACHGLCSIKLFADEAPLVLSAKQTPQYFDLLFAVLILAIVF